MSNQTEKKLLWLDCDPGHDDAMAIYMAAYSEKVELIGISTVYGNNTLEKVTNNALKILRMGGIYGIPVYKGMAKPLTRKVTTAESIHGDSGLDGCVLPDTDQKAITEDVLHQIYLKIKSLPKKIHFVATGCLTNLALLLSTFPDFKDYIEQISLMGGAIGIGNWFPCSEFNIGIDPEASKIIFTSGLPLTMVPIELTHQVSITEDIFDKLKAMKTHFGENIVGLMTFFKHTYKTVFGLDLVPLHDPCAVYYVINPDAFTVKFLNVVIETNSEYCDGRTVVDEYKTTGRKPNTNVAVGLDLNAFWEEMLSALHKCNKNTPINNQ
ncbi:inosine-uridine preferring nucleoside hydrolase (macronuclear) [Tetrahymena thermophila SB210]|uniref:Inosine-uridine preferring nucleoside hydrolase n=1 Tax=Tetrahymena thermophila (strain SB210) TaxID=312017 RepID=I7LT61_TETTS|nr:inosine-uridine preferring nucleoside hydrolase [Tetrahymena thermophila SB210]EAR84460.1 inosine-uridine preferring nucleoside hydrolase [Tetrahymena thermophila SB210]|eukprot:XP_001032123.1 inosine-uridine preferring nucleoside hydrolase [Tetrahymena thermophila SB210]